MKIVLRLKVKTDIDITVAITNRNYLKPNNYSMKLLSLIKQK